MTEIKGWPFVGLFIILAVVFVILAILYALGVIGLLASSGHTHHYTHAVLLGALALASLVAASFSRPSAT